ncbi:hypothetical protein GN244_ATG11629 [Phytophthora infestans]|uniref:Uncharacterized protein n=2 Tax=Phytophthora infestans TaxID=4787 RepID=A0A833SLF2_PHYIN|nr:hypothetical protein GN244_ATG11629 [Phytophthora infestans]KAF4150219.1 hypothetical protein GN958_ATG00640 [Phytophthora infestans]
MTNVVIPGEGSVVQALFTVQQLWPSMHEAHQIPSTKFVAVVTTFVNFLRLCSHKELLLRVCKHRVMLNGLHRIYKDVCELVEAMSVAASTNWAELWTDDIQTQEIVLTATVSDSAMVFNELQDAQSQVEALLVLTVELEQREACQRGENVDN